MEKILFYSPSLYRGGAQRVLSVIMNRLVDEYEVGLITDITPGRPEKEYRLDPAIKRYYLSEDERVRSSIKRILMLRKIMKSERPGMLVSFLGAPNIRNIISGIGMKVKTVVSVRNDPYREYGSGIRKMVANLLFKKVDRCVFQTEEARAYFPGLSDQKAAIIANPVDERFFQTDWLGDSRDICVVGRLEKQKNPELVMKAMAQVRKRYPEYSLHFYGAGRLLESLKAECEQAGMQASVSFHGEVADIENVLVHAFAYVLCSDHEGMPNALMEAMAVGCPVISTDCPCGGPRTLIKQRENGMLIPCGDEACLASTICSLIENPELRLSIAKNARRSAESFRAEAIVDEWKRVVFNG